MLVFQKHHFTSEPVTAVWAVIGAVNNEQHTSTLLYIILTLLAMVIARWTASASSCTWNIPKVSEKTQKSPVKPNDEQTPKSINNPWKCNMETGKTRSRRESGSAANILKENIFMVPGFEWLLYLLRSAYLNALRSTNTQIQCFSGTLV